MNQISASSLSADTSSRAGEPLSAGQPYWNAGCLSLFTLLMAGQRLPVRVSMMLGDAQYARQTLRIACTLQNHALQQLAVSMLGRIPSGSGTAHPARPWCH